MGATVKTDIPGLGWVATQVGEETGHFRNNSGKPLRWRISTTVPALNDLTGNEVNPGEEVSYSLAAGETLYFAQMGGFSEGYIQPITITPAG